MAKAKAPPKARADRNELLDTFGGDAELLASHSVTEEELELLKTVSLFGNLTSPRDVEFILKNIRGGKPTR